MRNIMAVFYKVYQDNRNQSKTKGQWYGRAVMIDTDYTDDIAKRIMEKCTVNEADVLAVIRALVNEITRSLQSSHRVKLPGFGTFKLGLTTRGAKDRESFSVSENVKGVHVLFQPEVKVSQDGNRTKTFLAGTKVRELVKDIKESTNADAPSTPGEGGQADI